MLHERFPFHQLIILTRSLKNPTCSYDEVLRFKKSAADASTEETKHCAISSRYNGMIQTVVETFDTDISLNGKLSTHWIAIMMTQPDVAENNTEKIK